MRLYRIMSQDEFNKVSLAPKWCTKTEINGVWMMIHSGFLELYRHRNLTYKEETNYENT